VSNLQGAVSLDNGPFCNAEARAAWEPERSLPSVSLACRIQSASSFFRNGARKRIPCP
jgi:hypothetical protein